MAGLTGMADTSVVNLDAHLTGLGGCNLDILNGKRFASFPGNGSLSVVQYCPYCWGFTDAGCDGRRHTRGAVGWSLPCK